MPDILELIRLKLASGPLKSRQLADSIEVSQPTISRAMSRLGDEVIKLGNGPSIQYVIRDYTRGIGNVPVYRVDIHGKIRSLG
ncbi:MAG: ArsR family transcriptional regulator, partial [Methylophilus sp.]